MFTRKKSIFKRKSFYIGIAAIFGVGFLLLSLISTPKDTDTENISANVKQQVAQNVVDSNNIHENDDYKTNSNSESKNNVQEIQSDEYYLVKETDGLIKIYRYDSDGTESMIKTTDILFSLLSKEDQELFSEGVTIYTEDELLELLQDFDS